MLKNKETTVDLICTPQERPYNEYEPIKLASSYISQNKPCTYLAIRHVQWSLYFTVSCFKAFLIIRPLNLAETCTFCLSLNLINLL